jgi:DNA-binding FadR family transcriptional regulator
MNPRVSPTRARARAAACDEPPIRIPKAAEIVSKRLRDRIVRGELKEGEYLASERALMERFGVSRPTMREAIRILESEGLITIQRGVHGGAVVHSPNVSVASRYVGLVLQANGTTLMDIYHVHMMVEPVAARWVAEQHSQAAPPVLRECYAAVRACLDSDLEYGLATANFRNRLVELTSLPTLTLLMGLLHRNFERSWGAVIATGGIPIDDAPAKLRGLRALEQLIEYIEAADGDGAEAHWRRHMQAVDQAMQSWLSATQVSDLGRG